MKGKKNSTVQPELPVLTENQADLYVSKLRANETETILEDYLNKHGYRLDTAYPKIRPISN